MENIYFTTATQLVGNREFSAWNDGHIEVEDPMRDFEETPSLPNISLDREQAVALRNFLNSIDL